MIAETNLLQRGRAHVSAEGHTTNYLVRVAYSKLQRGRAHVSAEGGLGDALKSLFPQCFNGAALT